MSYVHGPQPRGGIATQRALETLEEDQHPLIIVGGRAPRPSKDSKFRNFGAAERDHRESRMPYSDPVVVVTLS